MDEVDSIAYTGEKPWASLGVEIPPGTSVAQMVKLAGLDWDVTLVPSFAGLPKSWKKHESFKHDPDNIPDPTKLKLIYNEGNLPLVRTDNNRIMSNVGDRYKPIQNRDALQIYDDFVRAGQIEMDTVGSLKDGLTIWGLAYFNDGFVLPGGDEVRGYLLLSQSHSYGQSMRVGFTAIRVKGWTTFHKTISEQSAAKFTMSHAKRFDDERIEEIKATLGLAKKHLHEYRDRAMFLHGVEFTEREGIEYLIRSLQGKRESKLIDEKAVQVPKTVQEAMGSSILSPSSKKVLRVLAKESENDGKPIAGTSAWNWYNAIALTTDHVVGRGPDTRVESSWFGIGARTKGKALDLAVSQAQKVSGKKLAA